MIGIGSTVWKFNGNVRVYAKPAAGRIWGELIWREHWRPFTVTGETARSWVCGSGAYTFKIPKRGPPPSGVLLSERAVDEACWIEANRRRIEDAVRACDRYDALLAAARAVGCDLPGLPEVP